MKSTTNTSSKAAQLKVFKEVRLTNSSVKAQSKNTPTLASLLITNTRTILNGIEKINKIMIILVG